MSEQRQAQLNRGGPASSVIGTQDDAVLQRPSSSPACDVAQLPAARSALGKRAKTVSGRVPGNVDASDLAGCRGKQSTADIVLERDQPLHVRERVARLRRFQMQDTAARLAGNRLGRDNRLHKDRVADCLRRLSDVASGVECRYNPARESGYLKGLQTCGSVWHCPVCAAKISNGRREELARLNSAHVAAGGSVWMTTYTISHGRETDLAELLRRVLEARRKMKAGRAGIRRREQFGVVGTVSVLEVTWSPRHGWHPHIHELVFSSDPNMDPGAYDAEMRPAWRDAAAAQGLTMNSHGFKIDRTFGAVADYIAKFGYEPESAMPWGVESEMAKGHIKQAREKDGMTPFGLLAAATDGLDWAESLWQEYCRVFKGRKQLTYSPGLKKLYGETEISDEELAAQGDEGEDLTLVEITPAQWDMVVEARARGGLHELVQTGRPGVIIAGLAEIGVEVKPCDMVGWRARSPGGEGEIEQIYPNAYAPGGWRCWLVHDGPARVRHVYTLLDIEILGSGSRERAELLAEVS